MGSVINKSAISISDIRRTIGDSSYDLGTLCKSDKVNRWSLWKPIKKSGLHLHGTINDALQEDAAKGTLSVSLITLNGETTPSFWVTLYGLKFLMFITPDTLAKHFIASADAKAQADANGDAYKNYIAYWEENFSYVKPTGTVNSPYRITDFWGYDHVARCQWWSNVLSDPWNIATDKWNATEINTTNDLSKKVSMALSSYGVSGERHGIHVWQLLESLGETIKFVTATYYNGNIVQTASKEITDNGVLYALTNELTLNKANYGNPSGSQTSDVWLLSYIEITNLKSGIASSFIGASAIYFPLSQYGGYGEDMRTNSNEVGASYWLRKLTLIDVAVGTPSTLAIQFCADNSQAITSTAWITLPVNFGNVVKNGNNFAFKLSVYNPKEQYQLAGANFKIEFQLKDSNNNYISWIIDPTTHPLVRQNNKIKIFSGDSANLGDASVTIDTTVNVPKMTSANEAVTLTLGFRTPFDAGVTGTNLPTGTYTCIHFFLWHKGSDTNNVWREMSSETVNFKFTV